jgi:hypothetical protein
MSLILERVKKVNEVNRRNIDALLAAFNEKAKAEMNGVPMRATRRQGFYVWRNGKLREIYPADSAPFVSRPDSR